MPCSLVTIWSSGPLNVSPLSPVPVPRRSIVLSPMALPRLLGYANYCLSCTPPCARQPWCIVTISVLFTCPPILFSTSAPSMWRLIFILSESVLHLVMFVFFMSQRHLSSPTYSPKACLPLFSQSFVPASTFGHPKFRLRGRVSRLIVPLVIVPGAWALVSLYGRSLVFTP